MPSRSVRRHGTSGRSSDAAWANPTARRPRHYWSAHLGEQPRQYSVISDIPADERATPAAVAGYLSGATIGVTAAAGLQPAPWQQDLLRQRDGYGGHAGQWRCAHRAEVVGQLAGAGWGDGMAAAVAYNLPYRVECRRLTTFNWPRLKRPTGPATPCRPMAPIGCRWECRVWPRSTTPPAMPMRWLLQ